MTPLYWVSYQAGICFWIINYYLLWWYLISIHWHFQIAKVFLGRQGLWQTDTVRISTRAQNKSPEMCLEMNRSQELDSRCFCYCLKRHCVNGTSHNQMFLSIDLLAEMVINVTNILTYNKWACQPWAQMVPNKWQLEASDLSWNKQSCLQQYSSHEIKRNHSN